MILQKLYYLDYIQDYAKIDKYIHKVNKYN